MEEVTAHDRHFDPLDQRLKHLHGATAPIDQRAIGDIGAHADEDLVQTIQWQMVVKLRDQDVGQKTGARHAARYRTAWCQQLHHLLAAAAGFLQSSDLDDLHLRSDHVEDFTRVLADKTKFTTAFGAAGAWIEFSALSNSLFRYARTAAHYSFWSVCHRRDGRGLIGLIGRPGVALGRGDQKTLQRQFELFDFPLDLFRGLAEDLFLQLGDAQPQFPDQLVVRLQRRRHLRIFRLQGGDHRLQEGRIIGKILARV
jgi:hypothetical protein